MMLAQTLKTSASRLAGAVAGLGLAAAIAFQPAQAFAQAAAPAAAPAPVAVPQAQGSGPALWVIRDADSTLYLFGTVHVLRPTTAWGSARVDRAFDSADQVWFEISNPDDQTAILPLIQQHGFSPDRPLSSLLTPEENTELTEAAGSAGVPIARLDMFRPWLAGITLSITPLIKAGYDPQSGVEIILKARAVAAGKPVSGFETIDQQVRVLSGLPEADQLAFLRSTLKTYENATVDLDRLVGAWAEGDVAAIERYGVSDFREESEEIYQALLVRRNTDWAGQIQTLLDGSGTVFIAVGAAHLAGPDSVQKILESRGVRVEAAR